MSDRTCSKWVGRYLAEGEVGLVDRSSAPRLVANRTEEHTIQAIAALRRLRFTGPEIAEVLDRPLSTVSGILTRIGMGRLGRLGLEPAVRYERARPGELIHIDRQANNAIHTIAISRAKHQPETRAYLERRIREGKTKREALRSLKRHISRELYHRLAAIPLTS